MCWIVSGEKKNKSGCRAAPCSFYYGDISVQDSRGWTCHLLHVSQAPCRQTSFPFGNTYGKLYGSAGFNNVSNIALTGAQTHVDSLSIPHISLYTIVTKAVRESSIFCFHAFMLVLYYSRRMLRNFINVCSSQLLNRCNGRTYSIVLVEICLWPQPDGLIGVQVTILIWITASHC